MNRLQVIAFGLRVALLAGGCVVIEDGEVGVSKSFGTISDEPVGPGIALQFPVVRTVTPWNIKLQEIKEKANVPSSEGLIVGLDTSLLFKIEGISAPEIRQTIGRDYRDKIVLPYLRNAVRDVQLPQRFRESIEAKLTAEQRVQQKQFELEQARKDAEIEGARAEGAAKAQKIVRSTLSGSYLQYLWIKTLNENPNVIYVATEANMPIFKSVGIPK